MISQLFASTFVALYICSTNHPTSSPCVILLQQCDTPLRDAIFNLTNFPLLYKHWPRSDAGFFISRHPHISFRWSCTSSAVAVACQSSRGAFAPGASLICPPLSLTGGNCLAYDEAIIAQQDRIQQEVRNPVLFASKGCFHFVR